MRSPIILGSLLGALAIHTAFIACGNMPTGGPVGAIMNVLSDGGVAHAAEDGGVPACACPVPPAPPETSFSLRVDRGMGTEEPMADYSTATVTGTPFMTEDGLPKVEIYGVANFQLPDQTRLTISCRVSAKPTGEISAREGPNPGETYVASCSMFTRTQYLQTAYIAKLEETKVEFTVPEVSFEIPVGGSSAPKTFRFTNIVFRASNPAAHFVTPPRAYKP